MASLKLIVLVVLTFAVITECGFQKAKGPGLKKWKGRTLQAWVSKVVRKYLAKFWPESCLPQCDVGDEAYIPLVFMTKPGLDCPSDFSDRAKLKESFVHPNERCNHEVKIECFIQIIHLECRYLHIYVICILKS